MSVKMRLTRVGRAHQPSYRIVVADSRAPRDGRFIEIVGRYQPLNPKPEEQLHIEVDRAMEWLRKGALPSDTVKSLLRRKGLMKALHEEKVQRARERKAAASS